ncbi:hypothetical protein GOARA_021_01210 [Gordonia araii NBRC 100433]|uniref:Ribbon-helix-helix protein CopG domain-containing protein n=1 Tax=Gordonia araii NBRC 100433 TaxID=1073574 RepID=G7GZ59_9ACTN|nr:DUF2191 domain-containing protein [Gordonia araii]NNG97091.1 DUF2191 domain-containing protein [Gordonia araii NBRC 100433]GAB08884.1 hypothetical protein GOARA_021_01210 [Gordonia araii NBRC 100433]
MRTTIILPDGLYEQVKRTARDADQTVTSLVEEALRRELERRSTPGARRKKVVLPEPYDPGPNGGMRPGLDPVKTSALLEIGEEGLPIEKVR